MEKESRRSVICHTKDYNSATHCKRLDDDTSNVVISEKQQHPALPLSSIPTPQTTKEKQNTFQQDNEKDSGFEDFYDDESMSANDVNITESITTSNTTTHQNKTTSHSFESIDQRHKHSVYRRNMPPFIPTLKRLQSHPKTLGNMPGKLPPPPPFAAPNISRTRTGLREKYASLFGSDNPHLIENLPDLDIPHIHGKNFKRRFESSVLNALRDSQVRYLLSLYNFVDEGLLKNTLLKFLRASCLDDSMILEANKFIQGNNNHLTQPPTTQNLSSNPNELSIANNTNGMKNDAHPLPPLNTPMELSSSREDDEISNASTEIDVGVYDFTISGRTPTTGGATNINNTVISNIKNPAPIMSSNMTLDRRSTFGEVLPPILPSLLSKGSEVQPTENGYTQCEYCQKTFSSNMSLQRHMRTHEGKRTHKCSHCSRSFYDQSSYTRHMRSHNGEKKHKCDQCSMAFNKRSALEVHIRTHTGERPFVCEFCGKGFSISGNLHRHILIHTGHRPYKCGKCPRAFNNPSHLARHISSFHT